MNRAKKKGQTARKSKSRRKDAESSHPSEQDGIPTPEQDGVLPPAFRLTKDSPEYKEMCNFEDIMGGVEHSRCDICRCISIQLKVTRNRIDKVGRCSTCIARKSLRHRNGQQEGLPTHLPIWMNEHGVPQFHVPDELSKLSEGEKLLIQQAAPYVPMVHLKHGMYGSQGHVCSFPQQINEVCKVLPRKKVQAVKVIKNFKRKNGEKDELTFMIRRQVVLDALHWLKRYNRLYSDITIVENNLDWMQGKETMVLPVEVIHEEGEGGEEGEQTAQPNQTERNEDRDLTQRTYGTLPSPGDSDLPSCKDAPVTNMINETKKKINNRKEGSTMQFPYVSPEPMDEHDPTEEIFCKAFPWLYPGGRGDMNGYNADSEEPVPIERWIKCMLYYEDGRFAKDKMWCFFVLNYWQRKRNQKQGSYFVDNFYKNGPATLQELQEQIENKDWRWIENITYYGSCVNGSPSYWRKRRDEIHSWINYHVEEGHGAPSAFMTLSCAEYHWPDVERLIKERYEMAGLEVPDFSKKGAAKHVNDFTLVIQEYFQIRVKAWLETVGKEVFKIKHHWLRYEFAPGRGQIHAHMLLIMDNKDLQKLVYETEGEFESARILQDWMESQFAMTASIPEHMQNSTPMDKENHPARKRLSDVNDLAMDGAHFCLTTQHHVCTEYCLRKRRFL